MTHTNQQMKELLAARVEIARGHYREALAILDALAASSPLNQAATLILKGESYEGLHDAPKAYSAYREAQVLAPDLAAAVLREGVLSYKMGDRVKAKMLLQRYVKRESGNAEAFYYLSLCEDRTEQQTAFQRQVVMLDGPHGNWSELLAHSE